MPKRALTSPDSSFASWQAGGRRLFAVSGVVAAVLLALSAQDVRAAGFGDVQVASQLGERLYARVPLVGDGAMDMPTECIKLIPDSALQDAPALSNPRVAVDRKSTPPAIVVTTPAPVMDPAVSFVLELGCGNRLRRQFVLLIDPPDLPQIAAAAAAVVPPAARAIPADEPRWTNSNNAPVQATLGPAFDAPLAEPSVAPAPAPEPRKAPAKPRPKPAAAPAKAAQAQPRAPTPSAPPPPVKAQEAPKPAGSDRLVLADSDPAAARPSAEPPKAAPDAREEALTRQIEALTKEVAKMREDMDKMAARNRELAKEAESSKTGWFAAGGLGIVLAGAAFGLLGRREKKKSWRDNLAPAEAEDDNDYSSQSALPEVREELVQEAKAPASSTSATTPGYRVAQSDTVTDLDVTKLRVHETGLGGQATTTDGTAFPQDILASWKSADTRIQPTQALDFSLDDIDLGAKNANETPPVFTPKPAEEPSEAARNALFEQIERVHQASKKS